MRFILAEKLEMSQRFSKDGSIVPVTLLSAGPCVVTQVKTPESDGYAAVQVGFGKNRKLTKPQAGHLKGLENFRHLREFRTSGVLLTRGAELRADIFAPGDLVSAVGAAKGRGFQGVVKRHGFHGSPASHGHKDQLRMPGSIASKRQGPVQKGKRMPGRMGGNRVTVKNLEIVEVDAAKNLIAVKGAVPGSRGSVILLVGEAAK